MAGTSKICAVIGAGDHIGGAIAKRFAREGYVIFAGRRQGDKLAPLKKEIEKAGGLCHARALDARREDEIIQFMQEAADAGVLDICIFNVGGNVNFPLLETTERVFRKVWEMCCYAGFLAAREAARHMEAQGGGSIFFTGATASMRGGVGYAAFASGKFGLRGLAQSAARELGPKNIHVAHLVIDAGVDTQWVRDRITAMRGKEALDNLHPDQLVNPDSIAETYWQLHQQKRDCWTHEIDIRPFIEKW